MPIPFACPHCGLETLVEDKFAGESGPCMGCGKIVTVPLATTPGAVVPDDKPAVSGAAAVSIAVGCVLFLVVLIFLFGSLGLWWLW